MPKKETSIDDIMRYEQGDMTQKEMVKFFQELIDSGMAWRLQGHYGRTAKALIENGHCKLTKNGLPPLPRP